jgi:hypothetical protein
MIITLFRGPDGWTAAALMAFGVGTMLAYLETELETWLNRGEVHV